MFKKQLLILLCIFWAQHSSCFIHNLFEAVKTGWEIMKLLNNMRTSVDTGKEAAVLLNVTENREIINQLNNLNDKLNDLKAYTKQQENYLTVLMEQLPTEMKIQTQKDELVKFILDTNGLWEKLTNMSGGNEQMVYHLTEQIMTKLEFQLDHFWHIFIPLRETGTPVSEGLFMLIVKNAQVKRDISCNRTETSHHEIVRFFDIAISTGVKAYTLLSHAYFVKNFTTKDGKGWMGSLKLKIKEKFNESVDMLLNAMKKHELPYITSCDPKVWETDENYYALYGYHQQTIYYSAQNSPRFCPRCEDLSIGREISTSYDNKKNCSLEPLNDHAICDGKPINCKLLKHWLTDLIACAWAEGPYRIRYVKEESKIYGTDKASMELLKQNDEVTCPSEDVYSRRLNKRTGDDEWACSCQCSYSTIKLGMSLMSSRVDDNYVIVGLRIHKEEDYIYIQIAEGKLEGNGYISNYSWVNASEMEVMSVHDPHNLFFLGDIQLRPGSALIGIGFTNVSVEDFHGFAVEIKEVEFDYATGKVDTGTVSTNIMSHEITHELKFSNKTPINKMDYGSTRPKLDGYTHVKLQRSDLSDDYGQTTLPLLDGVPILTNPLSPIGGVGLFYKSYSGDYAGFLSFRLYPLNFTYLIETFRESYDVDSLLN